jgi:4-amino-4-deoxy-L-arabinose transferase-like glycosyltransferase
MSMSWHNFFFGSFDPNGTITPDKLPGAFWVQALFVRALGVHPWAIVLPQILEGFSRCWCSIETQWFNDFPIAPQLCIFCPRVLQIATVQAIDNDVAHCEHTGLAVASDFSSHLPVGV